MDTDEVPVLAADRVTKHFAVRGRLGRGGAVARAVEETTLALRRGQIVALVGESGSGKTTLARMLAGLHTPTSGSVRLEGRPVTELDRRDYRRRVQLIFQDPFGSLNGLHRVRYILRRPLELHGHARGRQALDDKIAELLERVNLTPAEPIMAAYPHELSGGQRQRLSIARALAVAPDVLLADEPISMLDVSIRLDILNLLKALRADFGLAMLYITHDIASARYLCDTVHVMYAGQSVEGGPTQSVIDTPRHPYTRLLLDSSPDPERSAEQAGASLFAGTATASEPASVTNPPAGCRFHPRCPFAMDECRRALPEPTVFADGHWARCWLHQKGQSDRLAEAADPTPAAQGDPS